MTSSADLCPKCQDKSEMRFQNANANLKELFAKVNGLQLSIKARAYDHLYERVSTLHALLEDAETPEQQSLAVTFANGFEGWGPDDVSFEIEVNTSVCAGSRHRDVDLLVRVMSYKSGKDETLLQAALLCDLVPGEPIFDETMQMDRECLTGGILIFHLTKAEAMDQPWLCQSVVESAFERMLTIHKRAGW